jgi:putative ABC transport system permease protein
MPTQTVENETKGLSRDNATKLWAEATTRFRDRMTQELLALPGVQGVTHSDTQPISAYYWLSNLAVEGRDPARDTEPLRALWSEVAPNYFGVVGLPLIRGRTFGAGERRGTRPAVILSESAARLFWPGEDALGKRFKYRNDNRPDPWITVIGICGDIREDGLHRPPKPYVYSSLDQDPFASGDYFFLKTSGNPYSLVSAVEKAARRVDPKTIVYRPRTLDDLARDSTWHLNYAMFLLSGLAWLALFLAVIGIYGVLSCSVRERTPEIGIRMALGASRPDVLVLVTGQALLLAGIGALIGTAAALGLTQFLKSLLYGVHALDPVTFAAVPLCFVAIAVLASYIPARRASRIDPMAALRHE